MQLVGVTGGIGSGKSTIAARLQSHGAHVIDADAVAREVVAPGEAALGAILDRFGDAVLGEDGTLNRPALAQIIFEDPAARRDLERITHPAIRARTREHIATIHAADPEAVIVYDVPLLVEAGSTTDFDHIVVAHAPTAMRIERLQSLRGMSAVEARMRVNAQATDEQRLAIADTVIDTSTTIVDTYAQVDALWEQLSGSSS